jgi:hypothetical protein
LNDTLIIYKRKLCLTKFPESQFMAHVYPKLGVYTPKYGAYKGVSTKPMTDKEIIQEHEALDNILKYLIDNRSDNPIH